MPETPKSTEKFNSFISKHSYVKALLVLMLLHMREASEHSISLINNYELIIVCWKPFSIVWPLPTYSLRVDLVYLSLIKHGPNCLNCPFPDPHRHGQLHASGVNPLPDRIHPQTRVLSNLWRHPKYSKDDSAVSNILASVNKLQNRRRMYIWYDWGVNCWLIQGILVAT